MGVRECCVGARWVRGVMSDFLTKEERSILMSRVRNRGTAVERHVRRAVWSAGFRYRLNVRELPGTPDLVFRRHHTAVMVQGCFWHGHDCNKGKHRPASNQKFWNQKLDGNVLRDANTQLKLRELGWTVFLIWECLIDEGTEALLVHLTRQRAVALHAQRDTKHQN